MPRLFDLRLDRRWSERLLAAAAVCSCWSGAHIAHAAPPDEWSLERREDAPDLVEQRVHKLVRTPFDRAQWSALLKTLGRERLGARILAGAQGHPGQPAWRVLEARWLIQNGRAAEAVRVLDRLERTPPAWERPLFELRITAWVESGQVNDALSALADRAAAATPAAAVGWLERAFEIAQGQGRSEDALRFAKALLEPKPTREGWLRVARAGTSAHAFDLADDAYAHAQNLGESHADEVVAERARARMMAGNTLGASDLFWTLLEAPDRGSNDVREGWWSGLGQAHQEAHTEEALISRLGGWIHTHPREPAAWKTLAEAQAAIGIDPLPAWQAAHRLAPRDRDPLLAILAAHEARGDLDAAWAAIERLLAHHPDDLEVALRFAQHVIAAGQHGRGIGIAETLRRRHRVGRRNLMLLLDFFNLNGEPTLALGVAQQLVAAYPRDPEIRIALGEQLHQMGRIDEAVEQWEHLPRLIHPAHKGHARLAQVLSEHERTSDAVDSIKRAMKVAPDHPEYLRTRAVLAEEQRRPAQALRLWEQVHASASAPEHHLIRAEARTRIVDLLVGGMIPQRRDRMGSAILTATEQLNRGTPQADAIEAGRFLAELYTRQENYDAAVEVQASLLRLRPEDPERLEELAGAQRRAGQSTSALSTLQQLLELDPSRAGEMLSTMSEVSFEAGQHHDALDLATRAATHDKLQVEALVRLGEQHERRGDLEQAARAYGRALEVAPDQSTARLRLAELELTRGDASRSSTLLQEVLERGGSPDLVREAGARALDLAETSSTLPELLRAAVTRTARYPEAEPPREFLLEALDRIPSVQVRALLTEDLTHALRAPLLLSLQRGSLSSRIRAAEHLGALGLPRTAVPLVTTAATLTPPHDATPTVRDAYTVARLTALTAAGELRDPQATPAFVTLLDDPAQAQPVRRAAAWALARIPSSEATDALVRHLDTDDDPQVAAMACLALAQPYLRSEPTAGNAGGRLPAEFEASTRAAAAEAGAVARAAADLHLRRACAFAEAAMLPDRALPRMYTQLYASDPVMAAIAAWRLGHESVPRDETFEALYRRMLGPSGLPRDAAAAALSRLLRPHDPSQQRPQTPLPLPANTLEWGTVIERWLRGQVAPLPEPVDLRDLARTKPQLRAALQSARKGTRAERTAAREASNDTDRVRLPELVPDAIDLGAR